MANFSIAQVNTANQMALMANKKKDNTKLDIDSFLQLIAAQIQNQDVLGSGGSGSSNEDYVGQMLQMTLIQSISDMMNMSMTSYATSMIGKEVSIADTSGTSVTEVKGFVTGVTLYGNDPMVQVNGKEYSLSQVMIIGAPKTEEAEKPEEEEEDEDITVDTEKEDTTAEAEKQEPVTGTEGTEQGNDTTNTESESSDTQEV
ncbi:MAG: hypothetical protein IKA89_02285 [Anaerotignum sp.]|nr:hypothetical protein [Anaerotignum sp.]